MDQLRQQGLNIRVLSFDGKSHPRLVTDDEGRPCTLFQFMRGLWATSTSKSVNQLKEEVGAMQELLPRLTLLCMQALDRFR